MRFSAGLALGSLLLGAAASRAAPSPDAGSTTSEASRAAPAASGASPRDPEARAREIAARWPLARTALRECRRLAAEIKDPPLRAAVEAQLQAPWLPPEAFAYGHPAEAEAKLRAEGLLEAGARLALPPPGRGSFAAAPGGPCPAGHHAYPGGLAVHTWTTLLHARALAADYRAVYGVQLDAEGLSAAALWHDAQKAATLPWTADASCGPEPQLARTGLHHALAVATAILRHLPSELIVAIASAHAAPSPAGLRDLCGYLRAGSLVALGRPDAVACPSLEAKAARPPLEAYLLHLANADAELAGPAWDWYRSQTPAGWARFEALLDDKSDIARWQAATRR